jgi:hypothetical protein
VQKAGTNPPGRPVLFEGATFTANALVKQAMDILWEIDAGPATRDEIAAVADALRMTAVPGLDEPLLKSRAAGVPQLSLALRTLVARNFSGTDGETILLATVGSTQERDTGYTAGGLFPDLINPVETAKRGEVRFALNVWAYQPKYVHMYDNQGVPGLGAWTEILAHELCLHAEPAIDSISTYLAGGLWPGQRQMTQHWLFLRLGVPRYLLWLNRIRAGQYKHLMPEITASAQSWAKAQADAAPVAMASVPNKHAELTDLRELASIYHLPQPDQRTAAATQDTLAELVRPLPQQRKLWWWPA